jgi:signal transduction histidine kinase
MNPGVARLTDDRLRARGQSVPLLVDASSASAREVEIVLLDHAEDDQVRTVILGALDRLVRGIARGRRQVDRQQDARAGGRSEVAHPRRLRVAMPGAMGHPAHNHGPRGTTGMGNDPHAPTASPMNDREDLRGTADLVSALEAATRAIAGLQSVDDVLQVIVDQVRPLVGARYAALGIVHPNGMIERFITSGISLEARARIGALPRGHGFLGLIIKENSSFRIADINVDPRRYGFPPHHPPMHSFLGVPITVKGRSVGNLYLTDKAGAAEFSESDQRLVETFAVHAGIAIENARLHEQVQRLAIVDERERISQDLHDGIIQNIYAVGLSLEDIPEFLRDDPDEVERRVERAIDSLHLTIRDIRNFIFGLRPELLSGMTLMTGLAAIIEEFRHNSMVDVELHAGAMDVEPDPATTAHLLGVVNEALSNIARHSGASRAMVWISVDPDGSVRLRVEDNGRGFDPAAVGSLGHQGLANMHSRVATVGATMDIESDSTGTRIEIHRPADGTTGTDTEEEIATS